MEVGILEGGADVATGELRDLFDGAFGGEPAAQKRFNFVAAGGDWSSNAVNRLLKLRSAYSASSCMETTRMASSRCSALKFLTSSNPPFPGMVVSISTRSGASFYVMVQHLPDGLDQFLWRLLFGDVAAGTGAQRPPGGHSPLHRRPSGRALAADHGPQPLPSRRMVIHDDDSFADNSFACLREDAGHFNRKPEKLSAWGEHPISILSKKCYQLIRSIK